MNQRINEDEEKEKFPEPVEDVWAGGDNLEEPMEHEEHYKKQVKDTEKKHLKLTEQKLRKIIKSVLNKGSL